VRGERLAGLLQELLERGREQLDAAVAAGGGDLAAVGRELGVVDRGGVALQRLDAQGYGLTRPIDTNATPEGQARNRRVEFTILAQTGG
jgi:hypothetical protein